MDDDDAVFRDRMTEEVRVTGAHPVQLFSHNVEGRPSRNLQIRTANVDRICGHWLGADIVLLAPVHQMIELCFRC